MACKDVTIVIPVFQLENKKLRLRNFDCIIRYYKNADIPVFVVEQSPEYKTYVRELIASFGESNITYLQYPSESQQIQKTKLINYAASRIETKYLWLVDSDAFINYKKVLKELDDQDLVKPFDYVIRLNEEETQHFIDTKEIIIKKDSKHVITEIFGPLSFIIKKSIFDDIGGMDENFTGWGWEEEVDAGWVEEWGVVIGKPQVHLPKHRQVQQYGLRHRSCQRNKKLRC